jgi:hypothetical protein
LLTFVVASTYHRSPCLPWTTPPRRNRRIA